MAHCIATASHAMDFAPRAVILLDPPPLVAMSSPGRSASLREAAIALLSVLLGTAVEMGDREGAFEQLQESLEEEAAAWPDDELAVHATRRLERAGLRKFTFEAISRTKVQISAFADGVSFLQASRAALVATISTKLHLASIEQLPPWHVFLMVCAQRVPFYSNTGSSCEEASTAAAHSAYGCPMLEMMCGGAGGGHFAGKPASHRFHLLRVPMLVLCWLRTDACHPQSSVSIVRVCMPLQRRSAAQLAKTRRLLWPYKVSCVHAHMRADKACKAIGNPGGV